MDEQKLEKLEETLYKAGSCAVIEVTNGICNKKLRDKIDEVNQGKRFIRKLTQDKIPVLTGIFFFRQTRLGNIPDNGIDVVCQIPKYESYKAQEALERTAERTQDPQYRNFALWLKRRIINGERLEDIFYPKAADPSQLKGEAKVYADRLAGVKGVFLEEYAGLICTKAIPSSGITVGFDYYRLREKLGLLPKISMNVPISFAGRGEIDLIIAAPEAAIIKGLANPEYFECLKKPTPLPSLPQTPQEAPPQHRYASCRDAH